MLKAHEGEEDWPLATAATNTNTALQKSAAQIQFYTGETHNPINIG